MLINYSREEQQQRAVKRREEESVDYEGKKVTSKTIRRRCDQHTENIPSMMTLIKCLIKVRILGSDSIFYSVRQNMSKKGQQHNLWPACKMCMHIINFRSFTSLIYDVNCGVSLFLVQLSGSVLRDDKNAYELLIVITHMLTCDRQWFSVALIIVGRKKIGAQRVKCKKFATRKVKILSFWKKRLNVKETRHTLSTSKAFCWNLSTFQTYLIIVMLVEHRNGPFHEKWWKVSPRESDRNYSNYVFAVERSQVKLWWDDNESLVV